ncbi:preprotein translocase subunit SecE [Thiopseudomonas denitrificans]|uniref:Protein translocase subunit SecE n=1 Tax=Thiopseudomonas denitrificans TaxID=1501432 RepID=A0A4R6TTD7_9GAMM|nr:preprotein translocase subunit SecE [Thiopseudomonas denitrificans]TDQ36366.1 protein translocase subunit secE/sec61 gamma [Thiopseudomonas denitrificans]
MNAKTESGSTSGRLDSLKWLVVAALVTVAVVGNQYFAAESILYRAIGVLLVAAAALFVAAQTAKGSAMLVLGREARAEIRKVVWPNRQETVQTTLIVVAVVLVMGLILWGLDSLFGWVVSIIVG